MATVAGASSTARASRAGTTRPTSRRTPRSSPTRRRRRSPRTCGPRSRTTWRATPTGARAADPGAARRAARARLVSPTAVEQVACVMRLTPGYLISVATFYDMFEHGPGGEHTVYVCTNISCSLRGARPDLRGDAVGRRRRPAFNIRAFECLGACDIAPMASVERRLRRPARARPTARRSSQTCATGARPWTQAAAPPPPRRATRPAGRRPRWPTRSPPAVRRRRASDAAGEKDDVRTTRCRSSSTDIDEPGLNTLDVYRRRGGYEQLAARARDDPRTTCSTSCRRPACAAAAAPASPMGSKAVLPAQGRHGQVPRLQRRRVRARDLQGPRAHAEEPAPADRGHGHRGPRGRRQPRLHLHPRRVRLRRRHPRRRAGRGQGGGLRRRSSSARTSPSTCGSTAARAPTSAARRPRCWTRWRASAATRASSRRSRPSRASTRARR